MKIKALDVIDKLVEAYRQSLQSDMGFVESELVAQLQADPDMVVVDDNDDTLTVATTGLDCMALEFLKGFGKPGHRVELASVSKGYIVTLTIGGEDVGHIGPDGVLPLDKGEALIFDSEANAHRAGKYWAES